MRLVPSERAELDHNHGLTQLPGLFDNVGYVLRLPCAPLVGKESDVSQQRPMAAVWRGCSEDQLEGGQLLEVLMATGGRPETLAGPGALQWPLVEQEVDCG